MTSTSTSTSSFLIPLTFQGEEKNILEASCSRSQPSIIRFWGHVSSLLPGHEAGVLDGGCAIGTQDGTLFLFRQSPITQPQAFHSPPLAPELPSVSRSSSPSATSPLPFNLRQRSRVVSGITAELVEAPKNYVDFDEEPDRLKDILQGRHPREPRDRSSTPVELSVPSTRKGSPTPSIQASTGLNRQATPKSLLSVTSSAPFTTPSPRLLSPKEFPQPHMLSLWSHVALPKTGPGQGVTCVSLIEDTQLLVTLQETGDLSVISLEDGSCVTTLDCSGNDSHPPKAIDDKDTLHILWFWNVLKIYHIGESTIIMTSAMIHPHYALPSSLDNDGVLEKCRISVFEFHSNNQSAPFERSLEELGQWHLDGPSCGIELHRGPDNSLSLLTVSSDGHFSSRGFHLLPRVSAQSDIHPSEKDTPNLTIPNPFKAFRSHHTEQQPADSRREHERIVRDDVHDLGELIPGETILGFRARGTGRKTCAIVWSEKSLTIAEYGNKYIRVLFKDTLSNIQDLQWTSDSSYTVLFEDRAQCYILKTVDADNNEISQDDVASLEKIIVTSQLSKEISIPQYDAADVTSALQVSTTSSSEEGVRRITTFDTTSKDSAIVWQASKRCSVPTTEVTSMLPLELGLIVQGSGSFLLEWKVLWLIKGPVSLSPPADGRLRHSSLIQLIEGSDKLLSAKPPLNGSITCLYVVQNGRTKEKLIVGGVDDGSVAIWTIDNHTLCARWTLFTTPLSHVLDLPYTKDSPLKGCILCISADGTVAVIAVDGFQFLYLVPGSSAPLRRVCIGSSNLLLMYADNRARLWDIQTQEFRRSMNMEKVEELLKQGGWTDLTLDTQAGLQNMPLASIPHLTFPDTSSTLLLDLERFTSESTSVAKSISTNRDQTRAILTTLERIRSVLSVLLTPGLNRDIDMVCSEKLGVLPTQASAGFIRNQTVTLYRKESPQEVWCLSGDVSAARALAIVVMLSALSVFEEYMEAANTVTIFYATSLASAVGIKYQPPSLVYLARQWFDGSNEVRRSTRVLFDYAVACLSDEESIEITEHWQHHLPCLQPTAERESIQAALALFLCGYLAAEKYTLLLPSALTDISKSLAIYLHDEQSLHRVLAVDLCSRGFHIWQYYIDAMEILRALFNLATSSRKDSINPQNVGSQARLAVLQIASSNTALFMTTLGLDILTPPTLEHRKVVMQIMAFLIRKRPLVLRPNIPKLMEAVVRSLDPNVTTSREAVFDPASEIIGYVVKTFPTVAFHMGTQRLAVGSADGAVVMYDLKTAIRLYVLEGHKKTISACSFSPDGRRLMTLSIEEGVALVWKVGSSFASFFNPGAPPRQGHGGTQPFKTINFNVGEAANMNDQEAMDLIRIDWVADRSVQIKIRDIILTFST